MPTVVDFDLNLLATLVTLFDERSVTLTARRLGCSQPSVSAALKKLRLAFDDQLFIPAAKGIEPTARAESLVASARDILSSIEEKMLSKSTFDPQTTTTTFTFAMPEVAELFFLPPLVSSLRKLAPRASIRSLLPPFDDLVEAMAAGEIDLAIGNFTGARTNNCLQQKLFSGDRACLVRDGHPFRGDRLSLEQYFALDHVTIRTTPASIVDKSMAKFRGRRKVVLIISHFISLPSIIETTDLVATVARPYALFLMSRGEKLRVLRAPPELPPSTVYQLWHRKVQDDPRHRWLRALVKQLFPDKVSEWLGR